MDLDSFFHESWMAYFGKFWPGFGLFVFHSCYRKNKRIHNHKGWTINHRGGGGSGIIEKKKGSGADRKKKKASALLLMKKKQMPCCRVKKTSTSLPRKKSNCKICAPPPTMTNGSSLTTKEIKPPSVGWLFCTDAVNRGSLSQAIKGRPMDRGHLIPHRGMHDENIFI